jgi:hypothetical protein
MKMKNLFILVIPAIFIVSCTSVQPRSVTDELYQTPQPKVQEEYLARSDQMSKDTLKDRLAPRRNEWQRAPYWMYEHYPYHPYGYSHPYSFHPGIHSFFPYPYFGATWGFYPYGAYYSSHWYGGFWSPFYHPYGHFKVKKWQRKTTSLPWGRSYRSRPDRPGRTRQILVEPDNRKMIRPNNIIRSQSGRKTSPPKRYLQATEFLRSGSKSTNNVQIGKNLQNIFQRKRSVSPMDQNIRQRKPAIHNPVKIRSTRPKRSSTSGRKRK